VVGSSAQTLSTGDIVVTKIFFQDEHEKAQEKFLMSSPKRAANTTTNNTAKSF